MLVWYLCLIGVSKQTGKRMVANLVSSHLYDCDFLIRIKIPPLRMKILILLDRKIVKNKSVRWHQNLKMYVILT